MTFCARGTFKDRESSLEQRKASLIGGFSFADFSIYYFSVAGESD